MIIRCPVCHSELAKTDRGSVVCAKCDKSYDLLEGYYDLYVDSEQSTPAIYTPETKHLFFTREKILSMQHIAPIFPAILSRRWNNWNGNLDKLQQTVNRAGTSERARVEFLVDDYNNDAVRTQEKFSEEKAIILSRLVSKIKSVEGNVLHVGCSGYAKRAIPLMYSNAGYKNWGVDVVRSYVREFLEYGEAHLANATALPFADETFDIVNFTDILEHLFDPLKGLQEASRVLLKNGYIILDTPNSGFAYGWNPIYLLQKILEKRFPGLKKPRTITGEWDGEVFFHTEFSKDEMEQLLSQAGFKIQYMAPLSLNLYREEVRFLGKTINIHPKLVKAVKLLRQVKRTFKHILVGKVFDPWFVLAQKRIRE